jgi:hypothetical protein
MGTNSQRRRAASAGTTWGAAQRHHRVTEPNEPAVWRPLEERVAADVAEAVAHLRVHRYGSGAAANRLMATARTERGGRVVTRRLTALLTDCVAMAWQRGWQPADLHRHLGRERGEIAQLVLGDVMAHQLSSFAESTIAPRWLAQLREIDAHTWWASDTDPVSARTERGGATGLDAVLPAALQVAVALAELPPLERLDPLPGTARPDPATGGAGTQVEERVLSRVRALLAKAESTTFEPEAETFTAGAQALMARHSIDAAMLAAAERTSTSPPAARRIGIDRPYEGPKVLLLASVADANRCRTVWSSGLGFVTVIGFETDQAATETIFTSLLVQATAAMTAEGRRVTGYGQSRTRAFRQSFLTAYAHRIGTRLREVTDEATAAAEAGDPGNPDGPLPDAGSRVDAGAAMPQTGVLVRVLAERAREVDERVSELFPRLVTKPLGGSSDVEGWSAGSRAADRADLFGRERSLGEASAG